MHFLPKKDEIKHRKISSMMGSGSPITEPPGPSTGHGTDCRHV